MNNPENRKLAINLINFKKKGNRWFLKKSLDNISENLYSEFLELDFFEKKRFFKWQITKKGEDYFNIIHHPNLFQKSIIIKEARLEVKKLEFVIDKEKTHCNIYYYYESKDLNNPLSGYGWRTKSFDPSITVYKIIKSELTNYQEWENGKINILDNVE